MSRGSAERRSVPSDPPDVLPAPASRSLSGRFARRLRDASNRPYLVASILLVLFAAVLLLQTYQGAPVPPGFDSADWTQRSYGFVGLAHPPEQAVGSPFVYPPLIFPFLGLLVLATQSPLYPGFIFATLLLLAFGLSTIHLSRRFLATGPAQVGFVAAAVLNGTTLSMLYWGGYPNFAAFLLVNEAFVCMVGFLRTRSSSYALAMWGFVALTYLDHTLTFALLVAELCFGFLLYALVERRAWNLVWDRGNLGGLAVLAATIGAYTAVTSVRKVSQPSYLFSNPAAYSLNNIGQLFTPLSTEPAFFPAGSAVYLAPGATVALLVGSALALLVAVAIVARSRRPWLSAPAMLAVAWLVTTLVVPVAGWYAHIDTVYNRFLYFLPVPLALVAAVAFDRWTLSKRAGATADPAPSSSEPRVAGGSDRPAGRRTLRATAAVDIGLFVVVVLLIGTVTVPTASHLEKVDTGLTHDQFFLQAMHALKGNPQSGSVLAAASVVRWTEALTDRGAYEIGPTWLLFFPWQIVNDQETYFALNGQGAETNNQVAFSYSGLGAPGAVQSAPMYSVLYQGINFPVLRVLPSSMNVTVANGSGSSTRPVAALGTGSLQLPDPTGGATLTGIAPGAQVVQTAALGAGGSGWLNFTISPLNGSDVTSFAVTLAGFPVSAQLLNPSPLAGAAVSGSTLYWNLSAGVGPLPDPVAIDTAVAMTPAPAASSVVPGAATPTAVLRFADPTPGTPFHISLAVATTPTSNPAVRLPTILNTTGFLVSYDIHFLLLPNRVDYLPTAHLFEQAFGYRSFFVNSEWLILQG
jgi:hypothetical protein